jgi:cation transport protein ChaC
MSKISRESIQKGFFQKMAAEAEAQGLIKLTSEEDRENSWRETLRTNPNADGSVWVFAYGSLLWNPAFKLVDQQPAILHGYHRDFNLRTYIGRGCSKQPGLVLGLEQGGSCEGQILKIDPDAIEEEMHVLWSREMVASAYHPVWCEVKCNDKSITSSKEPKPSAIAFVMDTNYMHYAGELSFQERCHDLAHGTGQLGCASDYLFETVNALRNHGIHDALLESYAAEVEKIIATKNRGK